jgi:hypothetical protein
MREGPAGSRRAKEDRPRDGEGEGEGEGKRNKSKGKQRHEKATWRPGITTFVLKQFFGPPCTSVFLAAKF